MMTDKATTLQCFVSHAALADKGTGRLSPTDKRVGHLLDLLGQAPFKVYLTSDVLRHFLCMSAG
jgi:hypothetical protein